MFSYIEVRNQTIDLIPFDKIDNNLNRMVLLIQQILKSLKL